MSPGSGWIATKLVSRRLLPEVDYWTLVSTDGMKGGHKLPSLCLERFKVGGSRRAVVTVGQGRKVQEVGGFTLEF